MGRVPQGDPMRTTILAALALLLPADLPSEPDGLEKDAETWFVRAGDRLAPASSKNESRRKCWASLRKAVEILDGFSARNPADRPRIQDRHAKASAMAWWIRRESPVGLLDDLSGPAAGPAGGTPSRNPFDREPVAGGGTAPAGPP